MCTYLLKYTSYKIGCLGNTLNFDVALIQLKFHASVFTYSLLQKNPHNCLAQIEMITLSSKCFL